MDKNDIIEYVMNTPHNTNRAVLKGMLEDISGDGGTSMIVRMDSEGVADKTWQEVYDALTNGTSVYTLSLITDTETGMEVVTHALILMAAGGNGNYGASIMSISRDGSSVQTGFLIADSADGYLRAMTGGGQ